jgi:hypothetical protein
MLVFQTLESSNRTRYNFHVGLILKEGKRGGMVSIKLVKDGKRKETCGKEIRGLL